MASRISCDLGPELSLQLSTTLWTWYPKKARAQQHDDTAVAQDFYSLRVQRLRRYLVYYGAIVSTYIDNSNPSTRIIKTHEDLLEIITVLKSHPDATLSELCRLVCPTTRPQDTDTGSRDAITLGVKAMVMVDPSALHHSSDRLERGTFRVHWEGDVPFCKYIQDTFRPGTHHILSYNNSELFADTKAELKATNLKRRLGITIRATSDIRNHLLFDRRNKFLAIYHYASFLKEQLRVTKDAGDCSCPSSSLKRGVLPRQLVLEVLDSLQGTLFPLSDPKSKKLLRSLVSKCDFDPEVLNFEVSSIRRVGEESVPYIYFADRLADLHNELETPQPRGWFQRSVQRKSTARHIMMATMVGVLFAVFLGMASLALSSYQTWIAYQAWQHPKE